VRESERKMEREKDGWRERVREGQSVREGEREKREGERARGRNGDEKRYDKMERKTKCERSGI